eukprot:jgi/Orpsp1_1/1192083/evm.model.d7180000090482.1
MQDLIVLAEKKSDITNLKIDTLQLIFESFIRNAYFPWVCLILLFNINKWKRPAMLVLIGHWLLKSTGDLLRNTMELREKDPNLTWPGSYKNFYISIGLANVFQLAGELIGDWYPLMRVKAIDNNKGGKLKLVYVTCALYNLTKVFGMYCHFIAYPIDLRKVDDEGKPVIDFARIKINWWGMIALMQIFSFIYDCSVIFAMKSCLSSKLKLYKSNSKNTFLNKFKQISEYRIFASMILSLCFLPIIISYVIILMFIYTKTENINELVENVPIDQLRKAVFSFNFTLMYVDQILLRNVMRQNQNRQRQVNSDTDFSTKYNTLKYNSSGSPTSSNFNNYSNNTLVYNYTNYNGKSENLSLGSQKSQPFQSLYNSEPIIHKDNHIFDKPFSNYYKSNSEDSDLNDKNYLLSYTNNNINNNYNNNYNNKSDDN